MIIKLKESVNILPDLVYDNLALLGYCCTLAANDLHHIHLCAKGDKFQEIHTDAEEYMGEIKNLGDLCLELAREGGLELYNETVAYEVIKDSGNDWKVEEAKSYNFEEAYTAMSNILSDVTKFITIIEDMEGVTSDVISELDTYARTFSKAVNYFIANKLGENNEIVDDVNTIESCKSYKYTKESYSDVKYVGKTWKDFIDSIEYNSEYVVDSSERDMRGSRHNSVLLLKPGFDKLYIGEVTRYSDGTYELMDYNIHPARIGESCNESHRIRKNKLFIKRTYKHPKLMK